MTGPPTRGDLGEQIEHLAAQLSAQQQLLDQLLQRGTDRHLADLRRIDSLIERYTRRADNLKTQLGRVRAALRQSATYVGKSGKLWPQGMRAELTLLSRLERIAAGTGPIIVGPWTGEVGFELLYWAPFVRWFAQRYHVDPGRIVIVSRGGSSSWYEGVGTRYIDALSRFSPAEFRQRLAERRWMKQDEIGAMDRDLLRHARSGLGGTRVALLHPLLMFRTFKGYWGGRSGINEVMARTSHRLLTSPPLPGLPERYVAVRFYFRTSFPDTSTNRALVARTLAGLTATTDVVLLNPGFQIDDHHDYIARHSDRIHTIDHLLTPEQNLAVQTSVLAGAQAFIGSYGGLSYLAPLVGVRSIAFYSERTFKMSHLELAEHVFDKVGGGLLTTLDVADVGRLNSILPRAVGGED